MGYPDELISTARALIEIKPATQANLKRAVSTAYYALFHLFIQSACRLWAQPSNRNRLARQFEHRRMKEGATAASKAAASRTSTADRALVLVTKIFVRLQQARHEADYDLESTLSIKEAALHILETEGAMEAWKHIENSPPAQDYLFSLLFKDRG